MPERLLQTPQAPETEGARPAVWCPSGATRQSAGASSGRALLELAPPRRLEGLLLSLPQGWRAARVRAALQRRAWAGYACPLCPVRPRQSDQGTRCVVPQGCSASSLRSSRPWASPSSSSPTRTLRATCSSWALRSVRPPAAKMGLWGLPGTQPCTLTLPMGPGAPLLLEAAPWLLRGACTRARIAGCRCHPVRGASCQLQQGPRAAHPAAPPCVAAP